MAVNKRLIGAGATGSSALVPSENFKVIKYTGTGASRSVSVGFQPDFVWIKHIGGTGSHSWTDSSRGNNLVLQSNETSTEASGQITLDSDGFTIGNNNALRNTNGEEYIAWCWKSNGGTTSSNSDGSITSTVQANADLGFSIVLYQGTQSSATVGHGLGIAPKLVITKSRGTAQGWPTLIVGSDGTVYGGTRLNESNANSSGNGTGFFQNAAPTTSVFSLGASDESNPNGTNTIAYCFADVDGYQKIGTYTGNASTAGPIVQTGFEPAFLMVKGVSHSGSWIIFDNKRNTTNPRTKILYADSNTSETTNANIKVDFLSNGFQLKGTDTDFNGSARTYIYWAVAADPDTEVPTLASSFNAELYTGNATNNNVNIGFDSGLTWIKNRTDAGSYHILFDVVRGLNQVIHSGRDQAEQGSSNNFSYENGVLSFDGSTTWGNKLASDYVAWNWKANDNEATIEEITSDLDAIAVYKFESNANDVTGNHNGTATDVTYVSGKFNNAGDFNNTSSKIVIGTQSSVIPSGSTGVSFSFWVYLDSIDTSSNYDHWFIGQENYGGSFEDGEFSVRLYGGKVYTDYAQSSSIYRQRQASTTLSTGQWYHIVATYDTSNANITEVYLNGSLETSTNLTSGGTFTTNSLMQNSTNISIGGGPAFTDGKIDQFRIYNHVLTASNVTTLYNETASDNNDLNLGMTYVSSDQSIVSANANAGFSIVKFDGDGSVNTVPHGLSAAPEMILYKRLESAGDWQVYHTSTGNNNKLVLNSSAASSSTTRFNNTSPTATAFTFNSSSYTGDIIAYCLHSVTGYQKVGSYAGNGSTNAITTGFKPDFVMIKTYDNSDQWVIIDSRRGGTKILQPNLNAAESTESGVNVSFTSTGFTHTGSGGGIGQVNSSGSNYIYWAVAKNVPSNTTLYDSFKAVTYTGNGSTQSITGLGFRPDFLWIKNRTSSAQGHIIQDTLRAAGSTKVLFTSESSAEGTYGQYGHTSTFDSDGFTVVNGSGEHTNTSAENYVAWCWKAGNNWESNIDGSIPSVVNANTANGFSIIKYTGSSASSQSVGHGLNSTPELVMIKNLEAAEGWIVWGTGFGTSNWLELNSTAAYNQDNAGWGGTHSSTVVNLQDGGAARSSADGKDYIAYAWHSVSGFSKIGTYSGTGSSNSITVGFAPNFVLLKSLTSSENWVIFDSVRGSNSLFPNNGDAESSFSTFTFDSNGFTVPSSSGMTNGSGQTYLYMALKMNPAPVVATGSMAFLVIAGGAGGGISGGGGAGGLRTSFGSTSGGGSSAESDITLAAGTYTITVGAGGAAKVGGSWPALGNSGGDSSIAATGLTTITSDGGGGGGSVDGSSPDGLDGGSGGGAGNTGSGGAGTANQGFDGGDMTSGYQVMAGGGGASQAGENPTSSNAGDGGNGLAVSITGSSVTYAGGGGGGGDPRASYVAGAGGSGGGGAGTTTYSNATDGTANTGGGGGGGSFISPYGDGGAGGSGIVILRLRTSDYSGTTTGSPTVTTVGDETILKFTGSGTYVHS